MLLPVLMVLISTAAVFIAALLGNLISFDSRYTNALASAVLSMVIVGLACWFWAISFKPAFVAALATGGVVFVTDIVSNLITFTNRFANALAKAIVFAVPFAVFVYYMSPLLAD